MAAFTNYLETAALGHIFGGTAYTQPTLYLGLFTTAPDDTGAGTEVTGGSYARQTFTMSVTGDTASNVGAIEFPTATAAWGTVAYVAVYDAVSAGNMLCYATLAASKAIDTGDVFRIPAGDLDITLD